MAKRRWALLAVWLLCQHVAANEYQLTGEPVQGGLMFGQVPPGTEVMLDHQPVMVSPDGRFVIGFNRDETGVRQLSLRFPETDETVLTPLQVRPREYDIERVDGLPPRTVTPDPEAAERIRAERQLVVNAKARRDNRSDYAAGFTWPASGRISGVYGSQRILNGKPGSTHYGVDVAAPTGTLVTAPAPGVVTLTHPDLYYSGGTIILDHGQGLSSSFLHLSEILVEAGQYVETGDPIGRIGATGRATGPHLDWRMSWLDRRVDPQLLVADDQAGEAQP
ncbi:MAG: M23 family metallopeptidase [Xanthomonadales bacterium]|nr:M23 family metallopeptidase [Xanthomonadales bacterium]